MAVNSHESSPASITRKGEVDAAQFGFAPGANGQQNSAALQQAVDQGGTIIVRQPGTYDLCSTVLVGSHTTLRFEQGVFLRKSAEHGPFTHVLLNRGALAKTFDHDITIEGLHLIVNGVDKTWDPVYGLRGQIAFFYVRDLRIERFRCLDLASMQFAIHICTFEDVLIHDVIIKGKKDGIHFGRGKRFTVRRCVFQTHDDAVALNAQDYATSNPELGWIEDGVVEDCHDLAEDEGKKSTGYFCRMIAGGWRDWFAGMSVQHSDTVVSQGRVYRVQEKPDGTVYTSQTPPTHSSGAVQLDGIHWGLVQNDVTYTAGVRNVVFRDIFLRNPRTSFSIHFDNDRYNRSYYQGSAVPVQEQIVLSHVRVLHGIEAPLLAVGTPVDAVTVAMSSLRNNRVEFYGNGAMKDYALTTLNFVGCTFKHDGPMVLLQSKVAGKKIVLQSSGSVVTGSAFKAGVEVAQRGLVTLRSDLPGLEE